MTGARGFIVLAVALLVLTSVALVPRGGERAAMLAGEGRYTEAIALLQRRLAQLPADPDAIAALARSYAALGEVRRAIDAFDAYLTLRPDDWRARDRQAELLLRDGRHDRYLETVAQATATNPTPERVTGLVELDRLNDRTDDEVAALEAYAAKGLLNAAQLERLGALLAERGDLPGARRALEEADRRAPPDASEGRLLLVEVLIQQNAPEQIGDRPRDWLTNWRSPFLAEKLVLRLARSGHAAAASRVAVDYVDTAPADALDVAGLLVEHGQPGLARRMLERWAGGGAGEAELHAFVQTSARLNAPELALEIFLRLARDRNTAALAGRTAEESFDAFGPAAVAAMRPLLSNAVLASRPLFAAKLALWDGEADLARWYLGRADPVARGAAWLQLQQRLQTNPGAYWKP